MRIARLITEGGDTNSEDVLLQKWLHNSASMLLYTYIACVVLFFFFLKYRSLILICSIEA